VNGFSSPVIQHQPVQQALERYQLKITIRKIRACFCSAVTLLAEKSKLSRFRVIIQLFIVLKAILSTQTQ